MRRLFLLGFVLLAGCPADTGFRAKECGVVGGQEESGFEAVGLVETAGGWCTGTLVAPRVVVTAQHCFSPDTRPEDVGFRTGRFGETLEGRGVALAYLGEFEQAHDAEGNPFWWIDTENDFAVVVLDQDPSVAPMPLRRDAVQQGEIGDAVDIVGYGTTGLGRDDAGVKRSGQAMLSAVGPDILETERQVGDASGCYGDSGGPLILGGEVVGVFSYFVDLVAVCEAGGQYVRVDRFLDLVDEGIAAANGNVDEPPPDDSCAYARDGECDEGLYCYPGTDTTDCTGDPGGDDPGEDDGACDPGFCLADDGYCDEDLPCCADDSDCGTDDPGGDDPGGDDPGGDDGTNPDDPEKQPPIPEGCFPGVCEPGDGYCDEDRDCCESDSDCPVDC